MQSEFRHALIMAAGRGSRMAPLTNIVPKPMVPLGDSTLILRGISRVKRRVPNVHITVGYKARMLAEHVIDKGIASIFNTDGRGNAWWLFNTLLSHLDEPLVVLTCDNLVELNLSRLKADYLELGEPACMLVPVEPVIGLDGDYIFHDNQRVVHLDRKTPSPIYCSGIQVINPSRINKLAQPTNDFNDLWTQLILDGQLFCSNVFPDRWFTIDTLEALAQAEAIHQRGEWDNDT